MTGVQIPSAETASRFSWAVRAAWLLALIATALQLVAVLIAIGGISEQLAGNPITVSIETSQPLHAVGKNSYGGSAYIADDAQVTATEVSAQVRDAAFPVRVGLAFGPVSWALTAAGVCFCLTTAFGRLSAARPDPQPAARAFAIAAVITAVGTSAAQVLDETARTGLQGVLWHGPQGIDHLGSGADFTFQFGWVALAVGLAALAAVVGRMGEPTAPAAPIG